MSFDDERAHRFLTASDGKSPADLRAEMMDFLDWLHAMGTAELDGADSRTKAKILATLKEVERQRAKLARAQAVDES